MIVQAEPDRCKVVVVDVGVVVSGLAGRDKRRGATARLSAFFCRDQMGEGDVGWAAERTRARRGKHAEVARP